MGIENTTQYIKDHYLQLSYGEYEGIREPTMTELLGLKASIESDINRLISIERVNEWTERQKLAG